MFHLRWFEFVTWVSESLWSDGAVTENVILGKAKSIMAVPARSWIWHSQCSSVIQSKSLIEIWAVLNVPWLEIVFWPAKTLRSDCAISQNMILCKAKSFVAVPAWFWIGNCEVSSILESKSLIEVWAVLNVSWLEVVFRVAKTLWSDGAVTEDVILSKTESFVAVPTWLWVGNCESSTILKSESLIEVWAVLNFSWLEIGCWPSKSLWFDGAVTKDMVLSKSESFVAVPA